MSIIKKLWEIVKDALPFLKNALERFFDSLPEQAKKALKDSGKIAQVLKETYASGYEAFLVAIKDALNLDKEETDKIIMDLAKKLNIDVNAPNEFFDKLQEHINKIKEDSAWDGLWNSVATQLSILLSGGRFDFKALALGIVQWVFEKFVQKKK